MGDSKGSWKSPCMPALAVLEFIVTKGDLKSVCWPGFKLNNLNVLNICSEAFAVTSKLGFDAFSSIPVIKQTNECKSVLRTLAV